MIKRQFPNVKLQIVSVVMCIISFVPLAIGLTRYAGNILDTVNLYAVLTLFTLVIVVFVLAKAKTFRWWKQTAIVLVAMAIADVTAMLIMLLYPMVYR